MPNAHPTPILSLPTDSFTPALARLDPANRALLDLSLRRGMRPEEIGDLLGTDPESVIVAREAALEQLGAELGLDETPDLDDLRARLSALPSEAWTPEAGEEVQENDRPQLQVVRDEPESPGGAEPEPARKRRSRLPLLLALLAVAAVVLVIVLASSGSDESDNQSSSGPAPTQKPKPAKKDSNAAPASPDVKLAAIGAAGDVSGSAQLTDGGKGLKLDVSGLPAGAYEVWLYDSVIDAVSIGKGNGPELKLDVKLPANASNYRYVDVSREPADGNPNHSGESVLRVPLAKLSP